MHSVLFKIGPLTIRGYGLMLALAMLCGMYLAMWRAKRVGLAPGKVEQLSLYLIVAAVVGARLLYAAFHWYEFSDHPLDIINPLDGAELGISGLVFYGGLILAILVSILYARRERISFWTLADVFAPSIALGIFLTRIGCFLNGCCFGEPCHLPWALTFPPDSAAGYEFPNTPLHPTQLYSSLYGLVIFGILLSVERRYRRFDGSTFWILVGLYGLARFSVDFVRYYDSMLMKLGSVHLTVNQGISAGLFVLACVMFGWLGRRGTRGSGGERDLLG